MSIETPAGSTLTTDPHAAEPPTGGRRRGSVWALPLVLLLRGYRRLISPLLPPSCRFYPTCSDYALTALRRHGVLRGSWLALRRLLRCGPWHPGGVDPVPPNRRATR